MARYPRCEHRANGNLTAGGSRSYTWTSFNMVATIAQGLVSEAFVYDSAHNRLKVCLPNCSSPTSTTFYLNNTSTGTMSEKVVSGSTTTWHDYVQAGGHIVAERFNTSGTITWRYFVLDHLGSTTTLTDASGTVQERLSYDPWGRRRNADGSDNATCSITSATSRGFTGHEMIDAACMINMNARLYDPSLGRFASADDRPSGSGNGQDWNTYAYVNNGPASATDPTGHIGIISDPEIGQLQSGDTSIATFGSTFGGGISYFGGCGSWSEGGSPETVVVACFDSWRVVGGDISPRDVGPGGGGGSGGNGRPQVAPKPTPDDSKTQECKISQEAYKQGQNIALAGDIIIGVSLIGLQFTPVGWAGDLLATGLAVGGALSNGGLAIQMAGAVGIADSTGNNAAMHATGVGMLGSIAAKALGAPAPIVGLAGNAVADTATNISGPIDVSCSSS